MRLGGGASIYAIMCPKTARCRKICLTNQSAHFMNCSPVNVGRFKRMFAHEDGGRRALTVPPWRSVAEPGKSMNRYLWYVQTAAFETFVRPMTGNEREICPANQMERDNDEFQTLSASALNFILSAAIRACSTFTSRSLKYFHITYRYLDAL